MIQRILILGGGSAGFLAAISLKLKVPDIQVLVIRSKAMGVIGVGEATTFAFPNYLHGRLGIEPGEFHRRAQPTWKLGIRFLNWSPRGPFDYTFRPQVTSRWENRRRLVEVRLGTTSPRCSYIIRVRGCVSKISDATLIV